MTGLAKGLIISGIVLVVIFCIFVVAAVYLVSTRGGEFIEKSKETIAEGERFGGSTNNQGCQDEALKRYRRSPGITTAFSVEIFFASCLPASAPSPAFCDDVPQPTEILKSATWRINKCAAEGMANDSNCQQIFGQVQSFCSTRRLNSNENDSH